MLKILKYKDDDSIFDILLITFARLVLTAGMCMFAFYLAFASTMGPTIAPDTWIAGIELDMIIRIGMLLTAAGLTLFAISWFIYPLLRYLYKRTVNH